MVHSGEQEHSNSACSALPRHPKTLEWLFCCSDFLQTRDHLQAPRKSIVAALGRPYGRARHNQGCCGLPGLAPYPCRESIDNRAPMAKQEAKTNIGEAAVI